MLALLLALAPPVINVDAGYYTLGELASVAHTQGIEINLRSDMRGDVYLLHLKNVEPQAMANAFMATGRLVVEFKDGQWRFSPNAQDKIDDGKALKAYMVTMNDTLRRLLEQASNLGENLRILDARGRGKRYDEALQAVSDPSITDVLVKRRNELALAIGTGKLDQQFAMFFWLLDGKQPFLSHTMTSINTNFSVNIYPVDPLQGSPSEKIRPEAHDLFLRGISKYGLLPGDTSRKLCFDPVTGVTSGRVAWSSENFNQAFFAREVLLPPLWPAPGPNILFGPAVGAYQARLKKTDDTLADKAFASDAPLPQEPLRFSDELLRISDKTAQNLVAYVGPFGDRTMQALAKQSLQGLITAANKGMFDPASEELALSERVAPDLDPAPPSPIAAFSAVSQDGILVVRDERDYLDDLLAGPSGIADALENAALRGTKPHLGDVIKNISAIPLVSPLGTYTFSTRILTYCNPFSLYPIARLYTVSPRVQSLVLQLADGSRDSIPIASLDQSEKTVLANSLVLVKGRNDAVEKLIIDPLQVTFSGNMKAIGIGQLSVYRKGNRYEFSIDAVGGSLWRTWLNNVQP